MKKWVREELRDIEGLSCWTFFIIVAARTIIGGDYHTLVILALAIVLSSIFCMTGGANLRSARVAIVMVAITLFYEDVVFGLFVLPLAVLLAYAQVSVKKQSVFETVSGVLIGGVITAVTHAVVYTVW